MHHEKYNGVVPNTMEDLVSLAGIGRKTANVVLGNAYGIPGVVVDTHVKRIAGRLGLSHNTDPDKIESDSMKVVPEQEWTLFSHLLIFHGRIVCKARKSICDRCIVAAFGEYFLKREA